MGAQLSIINKHQNTQYFLGPAETLGREDANTIQILDNRASRYHARIRFNGQQYILQDMGSRNQTIVNGKAVTTTILKDTDEIIIGDTVIKFLLAPSTSDETETVEIPPELAIPLISKVKARHSIDELLAPELTKTQGVDKTLQSTNRRLTTLYKVSSTTGTIMDPSRLLENIMDILFLEFMADRGCIALMDEQTQSLPSKPQIMRRRDHSNEYNMPIDCSISRTIMKEVMEKRIAILSDDAMKDSRFRDGESIITQEIRSAMCAPMIFQDKLIGVIHLDTDKASGAFNESDLSLLTGIAQQAAGALNNARLYRETKKNSLKLIALQDAIQILSSYLDADIIVEQTVKLACGLMGARRASISLINKENNKLEIKYAIGVPPEIWRGVAFEEGVSGMAIDVDSSLSGMVFKSNKPLIVNSKSELPSDFSDGGPGKYKTNPFMIVPIPVKDKWESSEQVYGILSVTERLESSSFCEEDLKFLSILASQAGITIFNAMLYRRATVDEVTGLYVRRFFFIRFTDELKRIERENEHLSALMMDIDHFKNINDEYGHQTGDYVLSKIGEILHSTLGRQNIVGRYGGEEFTAILPDTALPDAMVLAEDIRSAIENKEFIHNGHKFSLTISIGVAEFISDDTPDSLISRADTALYSAKSAGRNCVRYSAQ